MKKLLLGCGVLLALGLGTMGYVLWQLWPDIQQAVSDAEEFEQRLTALEAAHPFDPETRTELDAERFATSLDMRVVIGRNLDDWKADIDEFGDAVEEKELGFIDEFGGYIQKFSRMFEIISPLEDYSMGPTEFSYHTRVLWAALATINAGVDDDPALDVLRGYYPKMATQYKAHRAEGSPPLDQLIGEFEPAILSTARSILKTDPERVDKAITNASAEVIFMSLPNGEDGDVQLKWDASSADDL